MGVVAIASSVPTPGKRLLFWNYVPFLADIALLILATAAAMCLFGPARDRRYLFPAILIAPFLFTYAMNSGGKFSQA
jgi:hypothetical protein